MALIIEDGTNVASASSFVTVAECQAYAAARGLELPATDAAIEILLIKAMDFINSLEFDFQGWRVNNAQLHTWPREGAYLFSESILVSEIPQILKDAQCRLAFDVSLSELQSTGSGRVVVKEKVGPLETHYSNDGVSNQQINPTAAFAILKPLLNDVSTLGGGGVNLLVGR